MINSLIIKNIALIDNIEVTFNKGLNVLSGETGAGKSIIIDSLCFVLGKRADKTLIRYGEEQASVTVFFDVQDNSPTIELLKEFDIEIEEELMLKRTMTIDGKNTCSINGQKVTLSMLKQIASTLVDIYGQNDNIFLLNPKTHMDVLDNYGYDKISSFLNLQEKLYIEYKNCIKQLVEYGSTKEITKNIDILEYQINEIEEANLKEGEEDELLTIRHKMNNSQSILNSLNLSYNILNGESEVNILSMLSTAKSELNKISKYDIKIEELKDRIDNTIIELKDISEEIQDIANNSEFDSQEYDRIENRIAQIRLLKKKYGNTISEILKYLDEIKNKYEFLINGEENILKLEKEKDNLFKKLYNNSIKLSQIRHEIAKDLSSKIEKELKELGIKNAKFEAKFNEFPKSEEVEEFSLKGLDTIEFLFSANIGQPTRELSKIISGGELSRFMLALKNIITNLDGVSTMIFDEIDTGISGNIAQIVAEKLYSISKDKQVLAVTHLPQLAAMADYNYLIEKSIDNNNTITTLKLLNGDLLIDEISRLIGGNQSSYAKPHAIEMKNFANSLKK